MAYTGLEGVIAALQGKLNQGQVNNLQAGYTGGNGYGVGGMHGAFAGLSPQAVHWLAQSGLLEKNAPQQMATTDASGAPLTGDALFQAQFMNQLYQNADPTYSLHSGVNADFLQKALGAAGIGNIFAKGYDASGSTAAAKPFVPPRTVGGGTMGGGGRLPYAPDLNGAKPGRGYHGQIPKGYR